MLDRPAGTLERAQRRLLVGLRRQRAAHLPSPAERRAIRASAGVAADELAAALGVSTATVHAWEAGTRTPGRKTRDRYAEALDILKGDGE